LKHLEQRIVLDRKAFVSLDSFTACIAILVTLMGASVILFGDWNLVGWLLVILGMEAFVFAYLVANSVEYEVEELELWDD
jgi:hypothetical protein